MGRVNSIHKVEWIYSIHCRQFNPRNMSKLLHFTMVQVNCIYTINYVYSIYFTKFIPRNNNESKFDYKGKRIYSIYYKLSLNDFCTDTYLQICCQRDIDKFS